MSRPYFYFIFIIIFVASCDKYEQDCNDINNDCFSNQNTSPIYFTFPPNFPNPSNPLENPLTEEGISLGRHLFYDPILSADNTVSCASCHKQEYGFGDNSQYSLGINQSFSERNTPTIINGSFQSHFDWDGKSNSLEDQAIRPLFNHRELGNDSWDQIINRLQSSDLYLNLFCQAFGTTIITPTQILQAIAQFERSIISVDSKFDQWLKGEVAFTNEEIDGFNIYSTERGDCFHCHPIGLFTDNIFHNNGLDSVFTDLGRYNITFNTLDSAAFKSPTLRNIEYSAPYMHDGRFNTLDEVIDFYNSGGIDSPTVDPLMKYVGVGLLLTPQEKLNLKAFLLTLTDDSFINNEKLSNPFNLQ